MVILEVFSFQGGKIMVILKIRGGGFTWNLADASLSILLQCHFLSQTGLTEMDAHILAMAPMLLVTVTRAAFARSSGRASFLFSGLVM